MYEILVILCSADYNLQIRFGAGFELMSDGEDKLGVWTLLGGEVWCVINFHFDSL